MAARTGVFLAILTYLVPGLIMFSNGQTVSLQGVVVDSKQLPIPYATVVNSTLGQGAQADSLGQFAIPVQTGTNTLISSRIGYISDTTFLSVSGTLSRITIRLREDPELLASIKIEGTEDQNVSTVTIDGEVIRSVPTPTPSIGQILGTIGLGVNSASELSDGYLVRGGNYDENLIYINNFPVYRPYLVRQGRQEGLSTVNTDLIRRIRFSSGAWAPRYGDKLSSVLLADYRTPNAFRAGVDMGLLGGRIFAEGKKGTHTFQVGARYKDTRYLLLQSEIEGQYLPRSWDIQLLTQHLLAKDSTWVLEGFGLINSNDYLVEPASQQTNLSENERILSFTLLFDGSEQYKAVTNQLGLKLKHTWNPYQLSFIQASLYQSQELEFTNLEGGYELCEVDLETGETRLENCLIDAGLFSEFRYGRNRLEAGILRLDLFHQWLINSRNELEFGLDISNQSVQERLNEYSFFDSVDFVLVQQQIDRVNTIQAVSTNGFIQHTFRTKLGLNGLYGLRFQHNTNNNITYFNPILQLTYAPGNNKDLEFRLGTGIYRQQPFYREFRDAEGSVDFELEAQSTWQIVGGLGYNLTIWERPFILQSEAYHKRLWNVIPYDFDNIRIRYYPTNEAEARISGMDLRLSGEFIPGTESWVNIGILSAKEDFYLDDRPYIRRPTDRRVNFALFFEDFIPQLPAYRVNMRLLYGSGFPYGPAGNLDLRNKFSGNNEYSRVDAGFLRVFSPKSSTVSEITLGLQAINLFQNSNTISYTYVRDNQDRNLSIPNRLTQRFVNLTIGILFE